MGLRIVGDASRQRVDILVVVENGYRHGVQMCGLAAQGFLHLKTVQQQGRGFLHPRQHRRVHSVYVQHRVDIRVEAVNQGVQASFCRGFTAGRSVVIGNRHLQKIRRGQAAFVFAGFAQPAPVGVLAHGHIPAGSGCPAFCAYPVAGGNELLELQQHQAINLSQGFPDFDGPRYLQERLAFHVAQGANQYAPMTGVQALREAIADKTAALAMR
ncbi:hypothetical protein COLO4_02329 [Corchorus olitorius]|uniref:Uncharacterized protein n=1 Tax=Corchorus olitorius TaxID=93759 RepID=A0A1R3L143_9ROSI|nr:hypothetical protein COLO4_02329 [Corchorus olitorius]